MTKNKKRFVFFLLVLMYGFALPTLSGAQEITYKPQLYFSGDYNDNVNLSRTDKVDDFIFNISPSINLNYSSELLDLNSQALVRFIRHDSEKDSDSEDYRLNLNGIYRMTERLQFAGKFNYLQEDTFRWRTIDLIQTGSVNSPIDEPGADERGIESFLSERKSYTYFGSFSYQLNEISRMKAGYRYRKNDYDIEENKDFEVHDVNLDYIRNLAGQKDQIGTRVTYSHRTSEVSDTDTYGTGLLWNHLFTETINLYTNIGLRYTEEKSKDNGQKNDDWGVTADIRLRRLGETNVFNIGFAQNVQTASGGGAVNVPRLYWNLRQTLSERVLFGLDGDIYITTEDGDSLSDIETVSFNISPSLKYRLTENYSVRLGYDYLLDHDRSLEEDRDIERNRVWIAFELGFPNEW